jgi:hypothetical protein
MDVILYIRALRGSEGTPARKINPARAGGGGADSSRVDLRGRIFYLEVTRRDSDLFH